VREAHDTGTRQGRGAWQGADAYKAKALRGLWCKTWEKRCPSKGSRYSVTEEATCCQECSYIHHQINKQNYMIEKSRDTLVHKSPTQSPSILLLLLQKVCTKKLLSAPVLQVFVKGQGNLHWTKLPHALGIESQIPTPRETHTLELLKIDPNLVLFRVNMDWVYFVQSSLYYKILLTHAIAWYCPVLSHIHRYQISSSLGFDDVIGVVLLYCINAYLK
jgi:hypothetical protein